MNTKQLIISLIALAVLVILLIQNPTNNNSTINTEDSKLKQFSSEKEFNSFIEDIQKDSSNYYLFGARGGSELMAADSKGAPVVQEADSASADDYSTTNIQIEGVDEPDFIKNDGKYIYIVSGNEIKIIEAFPADEMKIISTIKFNGSVQNIFLNEDQLIVFENEGYYGYPILYKSMGIAVDASVDAGEGRSSEPYYAPEEEPKFNSYVIIYDISDRENPKLDREIGYDGNYMDARMINDFVYLISSKYLNFDRISPPIYLVDGIEQEVATTAIYYPPFRDSGYQFTTVAAIGLEDESFETETYLLGASYTLFVSNDNIYLTQYKMPDENEIRQLQLETIYKQLLPSETVGKIEDILDDEDLEEYEKDSEIQSLFYDQISKIPIEDTKDLEEKMQKAFQDYSNRASKLQKTAIYKISIDKEEIKYVATGLVPGTVLNQFSMDEYNGNLRIATTTGNSWWGFGSTGSQTLNHLYILNEDLEIIGSVEDLAKGEQIYSTRFMGDKAYMVTYRTVDPLFVIDTSDPTNPEVLGYLKVSGYSSYLQPYDEDHLIGIGMETEIVGNDRALNQGVKISLFDVSDFENPVEVDKIEIGDRGSYTNAMYDHKAVLFDKEKNLLVIPITVYKESQNNKESWWNQEFVHDGAYVFDIDETGIKERGVIVHSDKEVNKSEEYYGYYQDQVKRSLFMDNTLYTVSEYLIKASDLESLEKISQVQIREKDDNWGYMLE